MSTLPHHLAAVWFADVVGYTTLSEEDEAAAWRLVQAFQGVVQATVDRFGGRVVKFLGDGALAEFPSTENAVRSACALGGSFAAAAREAGMGGRSLRVGVHVGDVGAAPDGDLFGDGVNVASRIQAAAVPGEVWVSEDVRRQLRQRKELRFDSRGDQELKGIRHPLAVHAVEVEGGAGPAPAPAEAVASADPAVAGEGRIGRLFHRRSAPLIGLGILIALAAVGVSTWVATDRDAASPPAIETASPARSVGVLPFVNMSGDPDQEYFSDGLTEEILNELARIPGLKVPARTSSFAFKGKNVAVGDIARELDVAHVLEGSVRKAGDRVRVTAQLIDARNGFHMWSETYDRDLADVFAVQTDVAKAVAGALQIQLGPEAAGPEAPGTESAAAHELFLRGNHLTLNRFTEADLRRAIDLFQQAIAADSTYAAPWTGIAVAWLQLSDDWVPAREGYPRAKAAAERAVRLEPDLAAGYDMLSTLTVFYDWDLDAGERGIRRTLELNPNTASAHSNLAFLESLRGRDDEAVAEVARAIELDPLSTYLMEFNARVFLGMRRFEAAEKTARTVLEVDPTNALGQRWLGDVLLATGQAAEALEAFRAGLETNPGIARLENGEARALAALGRRDEARAIAERMEAEAAERYVRAEEIAGVWAALGDADRAFYWLDRAIEDRSAGIPFLTLYPMYDPLRSDPRFDALVGRLGLPDPNR